VAGRHTLPCGRPGRLFRELLRRLPDIRVAPGAGPVRVPSPLVAAIASLPVMFTPEGGASDRPPAR